VKYLITPPSLPIPHSKFKVVTLRFDAIKEELIKPIPVGIYSWNLIEIGHQLLLVVT
jgi:hypothetical protein